MSVLNLNKENYEEYINSDVPILVEFSASWCVYCRRLAPVFNEVHQQYKDDLNFGIVDVDDEPTLAEKEKIEVLPTLLLYNNGEILDSIVAPKSKAELEEFIQKR